jgi:phosphoglycolate phosphatase-like HAD superfamily hydrolase
MIKTILFDIDGVFFSEDACFYSTALAVWELMYSEEYLGLPERTFTTDPDSSQITSIRREVFDNEKALQFVKNRGINSNADMVFLSFSHQLLKLLKELSKEYPNDLDELLHKPIDKNALQAIGELYRNSSISFNPDYTTFVDDFSKTQAQKQDLLLFSNELAKEWLNLDKDLFGKPNSSELWAIGRNIYQEWYFGDYYYKQEKGKLPINHGKPGFLEDECTLSQPEEVYDLLSDLKKKGYQLGIGTGRTLIEVELPFKKIGLWSFFDAERIVTTSDVTAAEDEFPDKRPLGKPQPFTFIKGALGVSVKNQQILQTPLPIENSEEVLIVGDAVADFMAAQSIGGKFAATLTGLTEKEARSTFEELGADYICEDILSLREILL